MKRLALLAAVLLIAGLAGTGCKKNETPPTSSPAQDQGMPVHPGMPPMAGGPAKKIVVPDAVRNTWKAVKIKVEYKEKSWKTFAIPLNSEFRIPDSNLMLKVGEFLPHLAMTADSITSNSNNLENPAVRIEVYEGGKAAFTGWLFAKDPTVHSFQSDRCGLSLVEAIKK